MSNLSPDPAGPTRPMVSRPGPFDFRLIVKCTRRCNYLCSYCHDRDNSRDADLSFLSLARIFWGLGQLSDTRKIQIIWHGGEPLLRGIKFFEKALFLQDRLVSDRTRVAHVVQSNGSLITPQWARFFRRHDFHVGVSLDGPAEIHNANRPCRGRRTSFERTVQGIETLRDHDVLFGILTVVNEAVLDMGPGEMWKFFRSNGFDRFGLLALRDPSWDGAALADYNRRYGAFMRQIMRLWFEDDDLNVKLREFYSKLDLFLGLQPHLCKDGGPCVGKYLGIEPDGSIFHCDKFHHDSSWNLGNVQDRSFVEILESEQMAQLRLRESEVRQLCSGCRWYLLCRGGCLADTVTLHRKGGSLGTPDCSQFNQYESLSRFLARSPSILRAALPTKEAV